MLKVEGLSKKYLGEKLGAVNDVSFELKDGEILSLVGESGSGKSTLLRIMAGLMKPDVGAVYYNGEKLENPEEQLIAGHEHIKLVFQDYKLKPNMSVYENIRYQLLQYDKTFQDQRIKELIKLCKLDGLTEKQPNELSGGQQQRLALARTLSEDPSILLMDEPFGSLDPNTKQRIILDLIEIVKHEGISLVLVTHDAQDALKLSQRIGFLSKGELLQIDSPHKIYHDPQTLEIAQFFGLINLVQENENEYLIARAEDTFFSNSEEGIEVKILNSYFQGSQYLFETIDQTKNRLWLYGNTCLDQNSFGLIQFNQKKIIKISKNSF